ncbi:MAG: restriction endonuclease subunit S [Bacteroidetes bacterium]|nr:restriction endonuclease subunit S [Bacteroidota bacterium]
MINYYVLGQHLLSIDNGQLTMDNSQLSIMNYKLPKHCEVKKLKYVLSIKSGDGIKSEEIDFEGTYPVYGGNGVMGYTVRFNSDKLDIIIGRVGAKCGNVRLVDGKKWISDNALVSELFEGYDYKFISIVLDSINLNSLANQNAQPLITGTLVRDKVIALPLEITEQLQIVQHIVTETKRIDGTITKIEKEIELLAEYRTALISEVVTGKIKVT